MLLMLNSPSTTPRRNAKKIDATAMMTVTCKPLNRLGKHSRNN